MGIESGSFNPEEEMMQEENREEGVEQKDPEKLLQQFMELNGSMVAHTSPENDLRSSIIKKMGLSDEETDAFKKQLDEYLSNNYGSGKDGQPLHIADQLYQFNLDCKGVAEQKEQADRDQREYERRESLTPEERATEDIRSAKTLEEVNDILGKFEGPIESTIGDFSAEKMTSLFERLLDHNTDVVLNNITRKLGLREKALDLIADKIAQADSFDALRAYLDKLTNLSPAESEDISDMLKRIENSSYYIEPGNKDKYDILLKANDIMGHKPPRRNSDPKWTDLNNPPRGWDPKNPSGSPSMQR